MTFDINQLQYGLLAPEFILLGLIFVAFALDLFLPRAQKHLIGWVSIAGLSVSIAAALPLWGERTSFAGVIRVDEYAVFFKIMFLLTAIGITLISMEYVQRFLPHPGEYYGLLLAGTLGMIFMASANELLTAYIALELLSFSSYVLVSYAKTNLKSNEAGLKYIILGALSSALLLYGISLVYGTLGTTFLPDINRALSGLGALPPAFGVGLVLITAGLGFKIAAVPFHMWTPDVYEGAPTPVTAYLSVASKAAGFALVLRVLVGGLLPVQDQYQTVFALLAVLTMTLGNLVAIQQRNIKRMLAYSSIAQAGYVLVGIAAITRNQDVAEMAVRGMLLHLLGYVFTNLAAFGAVIAFQNLSNGREMIADMAGLARRAPFVALAMMAALFSLAGMPLFAGFVTKFYLFAAAARADLLWLVAIAVLNSTISLYYYLLVVYQMYVRTPPGFEEEGHGAHAVAHTSAVGVPLALSPAYATSAVAVAEHGGGDAPARPAAGVAYQAQVDYSGQGANGQGANGHAGAGSGAAPGHGPAGSSDRHGAADDLGSDVHAGHSADGSHGAGGPDVPWWKRRITGDMTPERTFPAYRIPWVTTAGLVLFLIGVFGLGIYPTPVLDLLQDAGRSLFAS